MYTTVFCVLLPVLTLRPLRALRLAFLTYNMAVYAIAAILCLHNGIVIASIVAVFGGC